MLDIQNMLLVGSAGRNSGKTTLAKKIIQNIKEQAPVYVLKIISIDTLHGKCHRGEHGCGVCTKLNSDFELIEEQCTNTPKDTAQLLAAGAVKAYLLKTLRSSMQQSIEYFLTQIPLPSDAIIVCESNSIRHVVKPGIFLFVQNAGAAMKPSAQAVYKMADKIVSHADNPVVKVSKNAQGNYVIKLEKQSSARGKGKSFNI